jgi:hypothetical protein
VEWKESVNDYIIMFRIEPAEVGFVVTAFRSNGATAEMEFEMLPHKDDVAGMFLNIPEFRKMVEME